MTDMFVILCLTDKHPHYACKYLEEAKNQNTSRTVTVREGREKSFHSFIHDSIIIV